MFLVISVVYLRHKIEIQVLYPVVENIEAVEKAFIPRNVKELKSYLGLLTYYFRLLPNIAK